MKACACGTMIRFGFAPNGTRIPLEPATHVYDLQGDRAVPVARLLRNHMITCPRAREFRNRTVSHVDNSPLVHGLLALVLEEPPSVETIRNWTPEQRDAAAAWASRVNVGGDVPKPSFLQVGA